MNSTTVVLLICLTLVVCIASGCPRGGAVTRSGAIRGGTLRGTPVRGTAARGVSRSARGNDARSATGVGTAVQNARFMALTQSLKSTFNLPPRPSVRIRLRDNGVIEAFDSTGVWSRPVANVMRNGQLWLLNSFGRPGRLVGWILRDGSLWEVSSFGNPLRKIGTVRATITGTRVYIRARPAIDAQIVATLTPRSIIRIEGHDGGWFFVRGRRASGWLWLTDVSAVIDWEDLNFEGPPAGDGSPNLPSTVYWTFPGLPSPYYSTSGGEAFLPFSIKHPHDWVYYGTPYYVMLAPYWAYSGLDQNTTISYGVILAFRRWPGSTLQSAADTYVTGLFRGHVRYRRTEEFFRHGTVAGREALAIALASESKMIIVNYAWPRGEGEFCFLTIVVPQDQYVFYSDAFQTMLDSIEMR